MRKPIFPYLYCVITFELFVYLFELYLNWRQYKKFCENETPKEIEHLVTQKEFKKSQSHNKDKMEFKMLQDYLGILANVVWQIFRLPVWLWAFSAEICIAVGLNPEDDSLRTLAFLGFLHIFDVLSSLPWSLYETFVISERHGFNKQTIGQDQQQIDLQTYRIFVKDQVKTFLLVVFFGSIFIYLILGIIEWGGENFYYYVFVFLVVFYLVMLQIFPNFIQPLFNKYSELPQGELREKIEALAKRLNFPLQKLYLVDQSSRSAHSNAYFYGFGKNKRIVLYDTLQKQCNNDEIVAILGHELGHWSKMHTIQQLLITWVQFFVMFFLLSFIINNEDIYISFGFDRKSADQFSKDQGYGNLLAQALIKIHVENASNMNPDKQQVPFIENLFSYANYHHHHPILIERLKAMNYDRSFKVKGSKKNKKQNANKQKR
ncbi:caax prenyl protease 1 homolog [Stylonychia lemnae]|uniref:CAAX prenyl protease n=1 Tax=Stylonychia lemnae TaxID=5949 RepID=A0A078A2A3_STYLE|nr:caax prenyl protease 1 homolog [Stylonychia lemnae]|eukprot:CDW75638.1 caax prenyl protease 1 homolog [Stylonychia lemnae]